MDEATFGGEVAHEGRGPKDRCELCEVARATEVAASLALRRIAANVAKLPERARKT